jgi:hypothetical protein
VRMVRVHWNRLVRVFSDGMILTRKRP